MLSSVVLSVGVIFLFTLSEERKTLQEQARLTGGSTEHGVYGQPQECQETEKKTQLEFW